MVRHIGIEPHLGKITIYDTLIDKYATTALTFRKSSSLRKVHINNVSSGCNLANECTRFFKLVGDKIGKLGIGNVVICCDGRDGNDYRKACLQGAKNSGYSNCSILSKDAAFYIQAIAQAGFHVIEGQNIAVIYTYGENEICMQVWNVKREAAVMQHCFIEVVFAELFPNLINRSFRNSQILVGKCLNRK